MRHLLFALAALLLAALPVCAQAQNALIGFSTTEKVGFAFYRLINKDPPVEDWIRERADYQAAKPNVQIDIIEHERIRLREGYAAYYAERDLISVSVPLLFDAMDNPDYKTNIDARGKGLTRRIQIRFPEVEGQPYFPFQLGKLWIGLIPENLEKLFQIDMTGDEYQRFCEGIRDCGDIRNKRMQTIIILKPTKADANEPLMAGDLPVWLMLADVGALYIQVNGRPIEWKYTAPWYDEKQAQALMTLFGNN